MTSSIELNVEGLTRLRKSLRGLEKRQVNVGILAGTDARADGWSNATIGKQHEDGDDSIKMPPRSWLSMPLKWALPSDLQGAAGASVGKAFLDEGPRGALKALGLAATRTIDNAFATGGFGKWDPLRPRTVELKGGRTQILVDTTQLRAAVTYKVV